jgi:DUF1680 family protein
MYAGMTDAGTLAGDSELIEAVKDLWQDITTSKIYLTGGVGASHRGEAFSVPYKLPNERAYCETCAAAGSLLWYLRMFNLTGDTRYLDVLEVTLYNGFLSGVSLDGKRFFYPNPLESTGKYERSEWFGVACCPGNVARIIPSLPAYIYGRSDDALYVNLFVESQAVADFDGTNFRFVQATDYPWDGKVRFEVSPENPAELEIRFRVPQWLSGHFMPGGLYSYTDLSGQVVSITVNGENWEYSPGSDIVIDRLWQAGDVVEIEFPLKVRTVRADERVEDNLDRIAIVRGPLVYAAEGLDNGGSAMDIVLSGKEEFSAEFSPGLLNGITRVGAEGMEFIPYYSWANRGLSDMRVWFPVNSR